MNNDNKKLLTFGLPVLALIIGLSVFMFTKGDGVDDTKAKTVQTADNTAADDSAADNTPADESTTDTSTPSEDSTPTAIDTTPEPAESPAVATTGVFVDYSSTALADTADKKQVLFFHAVWCPTCIQVERNIKAGVLPQDVAVIKVDLDQERDLVKKYGVTLQTHFVQIDSDGNQIKDWNWLGKPSAGADDVASEVI